MIMAPLLCTLPRRLSLHITFHFFSVLALGEEEQPNYMIKYADRMETLLAAAPVQRGRSNDVEHLQSFFG